jgi:type 1 fimbria pilin
MMSRNSFLAAAAVALVALAGPQLLAADGKVHEATVVKAGDDKITLTFKGDDSKHSHDVAKDAKITLDGKDAKLEDLKEGATVKATMDDKFVVHKIEAKSKK